MFDSVFGRSFNSAKCKTLLRLGVSRIKLLRNKRDIQLKQMKKELAQLLQSNQEPSARIRVEHIFREQNIMAAYEVIELFCELIIVRLPIIDSQRQCPIDLREAVASLIFAAPRCSDVPELLQVRNLFTVKYGKEFVIAAAELRPDCGVNRVVIEKLSVRAPSGEVKLELMKDIAAEQNVDWDPTATESELLKAPEDLLEGPTRFLGASQMSLETTSEEPSITEFVAQSNPESELKDAKGTVFGSSEALPDEKQFIPFVSPSFGDASLSRKRPTSQSEAEREALTLSPGSSPPISRDKSTGLGADREGEFVNNREERFQDVVLAARAAAEAAERAAAAAWAAASLASKKFERSAVESRPAADSDDSGSDDGGDRTSEIEGRAPEMQSKSRRDSFNSYSGSGQFFFDEPKEGKGYESASAFPIRKAEEEDIDDDAQMAEHSEWRPGTRVPTFDDQDGLDSGPSFSESWNLNNKNNREEKSSFEFGGEVPRFDTDQANAADSETEDSTPNSAAARNSHVHPKLPDFDDLSARFNALRSKRRYG